MIQSWRAEPMNFNGSVLESWVEATCENNLWPKDFFLVWSETPKQFSFNLFGSHLVPITGTLPSRIPNSRVIPTIRRIAMPGTIF